MARHLIVRLDAPLMSFGGETIDAYGIVRDFPARSMITGLLGNALGYERHDGERLDRLQARLVVGSARAQEGTRLRDYQTARLRADDQGWTTFGKIEGRNRSSSSFQPDPELERKAGLADRVQTHERYRDVDADAIVLVALRLEPREEAPTLDDVAAALDRPERPLFIGRKPCLPSGPLRMDTIEALDVRSALMAVLATTAQPGSYRAQWPEGEAEHAVATLIADERDWQVGVHTGQRRVVEGRLVVPA